MHGVLAATGAAGQARGVGGPVLRDAPRSRHDRVLPAFVEGRVPARRHGLRPDPHPGARTRTPDPGDDRRQPGRHPPIGDLSPEAPTPEAPDLSGASVPCALGRIRTCNLLIRSQMLYPLSYECLFFCSCLRFGSFRPVPATGRTLHDCRRHVKSDWLTPSDLRKRP
ncbi:hypothetical protein SGPA1_50133 [Streptomyces misionensis JCM 4497]